MFDKPFQHFRTGCTSGLNHAQFAAEIMQANKNFRSSLAQGDFGGASQWLQELMGLCFDQQQSVQDVQASMRVLSTIFCGGLAEYKSRYHAENLDVGAIAEELASYATANQLNQALLERLDALKALAIARNSEEKTQLREELIAYIEKNCTRYDLTVSSMSAYFNMTVSSLSQKFRKITGMGVLEYITQAKIRKAKVLLETRQYTISQIAELVGYNDASTFIRNFKKSRERLPRPVSAGAGKGSDGGGSAESGERVTLPLFPRANTSAISRLRGESGAMLSAYPPSLSLKCGKPILPPPVLTGREKTASEVWKPVSAPNLARFLLISRRALFLCSD